MQIDDRVKLLIERIEQFPEEFEQIEGNFTHLKWLSWFKHHYDSLTAIERGAVDLAVKEAKRKLALQSIIETITSDCKTAYAADILPNGILRERMQGTTKPI